MSLAGLPVFDDGRLVEIIPLSNSADPDSNKDAPLKVGFVNGFLSLSLGGAPSVKYTYQSGGSQINVASNDGPLLIFYDDRIGDSILEGGKLGDFIYGGSGNDILRGGEGDDTLMGNLGINIIQGGSGSNTASYVGYDGPNSPDTLGVEVFLDEREAYNKEGFVFYDTLVDIQNVVGTRFIDLLVGDAGDNILEGLNGADVIRGGPGIDTSSYETSPFSVDVNLTTNINNGGDAWGDILERIENLRGSRQDDILTGDAKANVLEGGEEADRLFGVGGSYTASYEHSLLGVTVNLKLGTNTGGDAQGDTLTNIENLRGSRYEDVLIGDSGVNILTGLAGSDTLRGMGGADTLSGGDGNDQLIATGGGSSVYGGGGTDKLLLQGADTFTFIETTFDGIEAVYVAKGATLDLTLITSGVNITSQSAIGTSVTITGTQGADGVAAGKGSDLIHGGAGNDTIKGGSGYALLFGDDGIDTIRAGANGARMDGGVSGDRLYGGAASDTFVFGGDIGQDNVYNFQSGSDHLDVSALVDSILDVNTRVLNGGKDTLVTFDGVDPAIKIVLRGVSSVKASDFDFGTQPTALVHHDWAV
ncbi:calcium-binding protein [Methylobacterium sp.]|uniref:calcium-binding protein n=1 Tax=Methylobacterium sp. TaxID=409 RepID=UPI003B0282DA